MNLASKN